MAYGGTSYTGSTWPGYYPVGGSYYYYGGKGYQSPQDLYAALGQPMDPNGNLPYGTSQYWQGGWSGMNEGDPSVRNNPNGPLDQSYGNQYAGGLYATPTSAQQQSPQQTQAPTTAAQYAATSPTGATAPTTPTTPAAGTAGTTTPATTGTGSNALPAGGYIPGPGSTTAAEPFAPLENPREAIYRGLVSGGYSPEMPTWGINQLLKRAEDIVYGAAGRTAFGGNADMLTEGNNFQDYITSLVNQAGTGAGGIMPSVEQGRQYLGGLNDLLNQNRAGGMQSPGAQYLNSLFGVNPEGATSIAENLLYSGLAPTIRSAVRGPLLAYPTRFKQYVETPEGFQQATNRSALDLLMQHAIPGYRPFFQ